MSTLQISEINKDNVVTIDFETYYGDNYSLKSKTLNTSEYIRDERFKVHMMGMKVGQAATRVYLEHEVEAALRSIDWDKHALLCHNTAFDGFIMSHHYGIRPAIYLDTLSMSRAVHGPDVKHNLDTVAKIYGYAGKVRVKALSDTKNVRDIAECSSALIASLSEYCSDDVNDTHGIFWKMYDNLTDKELKLIDITIRAFCDPVLGVDLPRVQAELEREVAGKVAALLTSSMTAENLLSADKFADALRALGVDPPKKISKRTGLETYAFAATDRGLMKLEKHADERVRNLVKARLLVKSTIGETRAQRFLEAGRDGMKLPVLLNYCGAHTFRWSGGNKMNLQNLVRGGELRRSLLAPPGHVIVVSDSAQIEARLNAWLSDELDLLDVFRAYDAGTGPDAYRIMASSIYGVPVEQVSDTQRFVGKVCLAEGSLVYSSRGWVAIETLSIDDKLWDGENWVCHSGLAMNGTKETLNLSGLYLTPDHQVLCGTQWKEAQSLEQDENIRFQALATGAESWLSQDISQVRETVYQLLSSAATAAPMSTQSTNTTSNISRALDVIRALKKQREESVSGSTQPQCRTMSIVEDYLIDLLQRSEDVTNRATGTTCTTEHVESKSQVNGAQTGLPSLPTFKPWTGGMTQSSNSTGLTLTEAIVQVIYGLLTSVPTLKTNEESQTLRKKSVVYDVLSVGPKNRFLALTNEGPIVVHNCVLALGYGMGEARLKDTLETGAMGPPITLAEHEYLKAKDAYRYAHKYIVAMWKTAQRILYKMVQGTDGSVVTEYKCLQFGKDWVRLPNGMFLRYPNLRASEDGVVYDAIKGAKVMPSYIYGGLFVENLVQALARSIIADQMYEIDKLGYRIVTMTHDEIVVVCPADKAEQCKDDMTRVMSTPPSWAPTLPLSVKCEYDTCYSK